MTTIKELQARAYRVAADHGFHDTDRDFGAILMLMVSELAEAYEAYRNNIKTSEHGFPAISEELADVVIRVLDTAEAMGIDLEDIIMKKMDYNETRPHMHGKRC